MSIRLGCSALVMFFAPAIYAQDATTPTAPPPQSAESPTVLDTVQVTGTRLARPGYSTPTPTTSVTARDIRDSGTTNLGDYLDNLPQLSSSANMANSTQFIGTAGLNELDLRDLGTSRTLVLVNGHRHVGALGGDTAVDINTIPQDLVERVDFITGGASAIYGADAVTGVVNFVLTQNFEGLSVRAQTGTNWDGGYDKNLVAITAGTNFAGDRGNFVLAGEFAQQSRLTAKERPSMALQRSYLQNPLDVDGNGNPIEKPNRRPNMILVPGAGTNETSEGGTVLTAGYINDGNIRDAYLFDPGGNFRRVRIDGIVDAGNELCSDCDYLDENAYQDLQPAFDRYNLTAMSHFQISDWARLDVEGNFAHTRALTYFFPSFDDVFQGNAIAIQPDNAYMPAGLQAFFTSHNKREVMVNRIDADAGLRAEKDERDMTQVTLALTGNLPFSPTWNYNLSAVYGHTRIDTTFINNRINDRFSEATDAVVDPMTHNIVCRATIDSKAKLPGTNTPVPADARVGCIPTNVFGAGAINQASANWFNATGLETDGVSLAVYTAYLVNDALIDLPAGPLAAALGTEYRLEQSNTLPDALSATGATFNNILLPLSGGFHAWDGFAETSVPLIGGIPLVKLLELELAARYSSYNTIGSTLSSKVGLNWTVAPDLRIRSTFARAVRAPNIGELYSPASQDFFFVNDPCSQKNVKNAPDPAIRSNNCAALNIPADFHSHADADTIPGVSGGNPDLTEERATTWTAGAVLTPRWITGWSVSVDFWDISINNAIDLLDAQDILNKCVDDAGGPNTQFCALVTRDPTSHEITNIVDIEENVQRLTARGVDFESSYKFPIAGGSTEFHLVGTYLNQLRTYPFQSEPKRSFEAAGVLGDPRWQINLDTRYDHGPLSFTWSIRWIDKQYLVDRDTLQAHPDAQEPIRAGTRFYHDVQARYHLPGSMKAVEVYAGVDNLLNADIPTAGSLLGVGTGSAIYDNVGRFLYAGVEYKI
ncbi:MAG TPA: TonB-dependent receptor [Nevskiaceae bacterium]|nr:TonB-dependent receptor [Nevskiaceae bacterium]